jgi:hypothetical protein
MFASASTMKSAKSSSAMPSRSLSPKRIQKPAVAPPGATAPHGQRILLVDDDPAVRDSLNDVLVAEGYVVWSLAFD